MLASLLAWVVSLLIIASNSQTTAKFKSSRLGANLYISTTQASTAGRAIRASSSVDATEWQVISPGLSGGNTVSFKNDGRYLAAIGGTCFASTNAHTNGEASWTIFPQSGNLIKMNNEGGHTGRWLIQQNKAVGISTYSTVQDTTWEYIVTTPSPTKSPTHKPSNMPTIPSFEPTTSPSMEPTETTESPTKTPTLFTDFPSVTPTRYPTEVTQFPTWITQSPTWDTNAPTQDTNNPTHSPSEYTHNPSIPPTMNPLTTSNPTEQPSMNPLPLSEYIYCDLFRRGTSTDTQCTESPTKTPTLFTDFPSVAPTRYPTEITQFPTWITQSPTWDTNAPTQDTNNPTHSPSEYTHNPSIPPTMNPLTTVIQLHNRV